METTFIPFAIWLAIPAAIALAAIIIMGIAKVSAAPSPQDREKRLK